MPAFAGMSGEVCAFVTSERRGRVQLRAASVQEAQREKRIGKAPLSQRPFEGFRRQDFSCQAISVTPVIAL